MQAGIHEWASEYYHSDPCPTPSLSASIATILCQQSPLHAWVNHPRLNPGYQHEDSDAFDLGTICHAMLLEGNDVTVAVNAPDWRTKDAQARRAAIRAQGKIPVLAHKLPDIDSMLESLRPQLEAHEASDMFTAGMPEQCLAWEESGIWCRSRLDWLSCNFKRVDDYKTTSGNANPEAVSRAMLQFGYDVQAAFYLRGLKAVKGIDATFRFCFHETKPPYALSVVSLTPEMHNLADRKVDWAIQQWKKCLESGNWPGYPARICYASLPSWAEAAWMERELQFAGV